MLDTRIMPLRQLWWTEPPAKPKPRMPGKRKRAQEVDPDAPTVIKPNLAFAPSRRWSRYSDLESVNRGYITELYNLRSVQLRYGLTQLTARYWRQHILPEPFTVSNVKNVRAFYWSRIQLVVMDTVLRWQEKNGLFTIRQTDRELLELIDHGSITLEQHYTERYEEQSLIGKKSKLGVRFLE